MKKSIPYSELALKAMCRASKSAQQKANENNLKLPIWKNGKLTYIDASKIISNCDSIS